MKKNHWNVLVFPGGMENGIEIYNSLKSCKEVTLFSASSLVPNQAFYIYKKNFVCPDVRERGWLDELNIIVKNNNIDIIFPANSFVIDVLFKYKKQIGCSILLPPDEALLVTRSKKKTIERLYDVIPTPVVFQNINSVNHFPVFVKPDSGYGAVGAKVIESREELEKVDFNSNIVEELLPGKEYTIDCFSDNDCRLLFSAGRERSRIRMATSMHAEPLSDKLNSFFEQCAKDILKRIRISGAWFFQMKEDIRGNLKLLEIDIRIAGTMCYHRCCGVNFPLLSLYTFYGLPVDVLINKEYLSLDRCLKNRYIFGYEYDNVYIDLDDTIILNNQYNLDVIRFLYQCLNKNKKIILVSKHIGNGNQYLKEWKIDGLFFSKIWLKEDEKKYKYISSERSIYIDDSFSQRKEVAEHCRIPTFDVSMIECLMDDRV